MVRRLCITLAFLVTAAACGAEGSNVASRRIVSTPSSSAKAAPKATKSPKPSGTPKATPKPTAVPSPTPVEANLAQARVKLTKIANLDSPIAMAQRRNDEALYVAEKGGRIKAVKDEKVGATVLDISTEVSTGGEQGLLGLDFSPDGKKLYINFTNGPGDTVIREYAFSDGKAVTTSARKVLEIAQPYDNHNGGNILFGPDGYLYIGMGDGGSGGDPQNNAQNLESLLGKMLRIDPKPFEGREYTIPKTNPFVGKAGRDEIWAYGLRNPWRFSFDFSTKALWIGDVGQGAWEEVNAASGGSDGGENYGWRRMEGAHGYAGGSAPSNHHGPIYEYKNDGGHCAVTGGYVYRGSRISNLRGAYVFADFCEGKLRAFVNFGGDPVGHRYLGPEVTQLASFGEDLSGELYVLSLNGGFYRLDKA
jgi:glucose/arabinose dehydrogenase